MTALNETPTNTNLLSPLVFKFQIKRAPEVTFFVQNVNLPGISGFPPEFPTPLVRVPQVHDHLQYDDLMINYKVDEDMRNYTLLHDWIRGIGFPTDHSEYAALKNQPVASGLGLKSDCSLFVLNSARNVNIEITFYDAFPLAISSLIFDTTLTDVLTLEAAATFTYTYYDINILS
jgi:hypothetical protein